MCIINNMFKKTKKQLHNLLYKVRYLLLILLFFMWFDFQWFVKILHSEKVSDAIGEAIIVLIMLAISKSKNE